MWWSLIRKELREIAPYAIMGGILYLFAVMQTVYSIIPLDNPFMLDLGGGITYPFCVEYSNITSMGFPQSCLLWWIYFFKSLILLGNQYASPFLS